MPASIEEVKQLSSNKKLVEFASFVLSLSKGDDLPDYLKVDLMQIPHLVPHIFVLDVLNSPGNLRVKYCGTRIDDFYGTNMTGKCIADHYKGEERFDEVENIFRQGIAQMRPTYTCRSVHLVNEYVDSFKIAETIMFPCSSDDKTVNFTLGFADYFAAPDRHERKVQLLET